MKFSGFATYPGNEKWEQAIKREKPLYARAEAVAAEPVYDACALFSAAVAEPVSRAPVSELLSAAEPVGPVRPSDPGHTADSASGPDRAMAAERPAPRRH